MTSRCQCCSFVEMEAAQVEKLAKAKLERIEAGRKRFIADTIEHERNSLVRRAFRRLFRLPQPTDDQILRDILNAPFNVTDMAGMFHADQECVAQQLLKASQHAKIIHVSAADLREIG